MNRRGRLPSSSKRDLFSLNKFVMVVTLCAAAALLFVHKEVQLDESARRVKTLQMQSAEIQVKIAEARLELNKLTSFPRISNLAAEMNLYPLNRKPTIVNISTSEIPIEFSHKFEPLKPDSVEAK